MGIRKKIGHLTIYFFFAGACFLSGCSQYQGSISLLLQSVMDQACDETATEDSAYLCAPTIVSLFSGGGWVASENSCPWLSLDAESGALSGTPSNAHVGACSLTIQNSTFRTHTTTLKITVANTPPTLSILDAPALLEGASLTEIRNDSDVQSSDEGAKGAYTLTTPASIPSCADEAIALNVASRTGAVRFQPNAGYSGTCFVGIRFDDENGETIDAEFSVEVQSANRPPLLAAIGDESVLEGSAVSVDADDENTWADTDIDGQSIVYSCVYDTSIDGAVSSGTSCSALAGVSFNTSSGILSWTPANGQNGSYEFSITGVDTVGASDTEIFVVTVNDMPTPLAATSLGWIGSSPSLVSNITAAWSKSSGSAFVDQAIQFFLDGTCTSATGSPISLGTSVDSYGFSGTSGDTYSYQITSSNQFGESSTSVCSSAMTVNTDFPRISINSGAVYTNSATVDLTLAPTSGVADQMYLTEVSGCGSGGTWGPFSASTLFVLTQLNTTAQVYYKYRKADLSESACVSASIIHDDIPPTAPSAVTLGSGSSVFVRSPVVSWGPSTDTNGIWDYEAQVHLNSDNSVAHVWNPLEAGAPLKNLFLTATETYYVAVRAKDPAGNRSADSRSAATWVATAAQALSWGSQVYGIGGTGEVGYTNIAERIAGPAAFTKMTEFCGLDTEKKIYCWGHNDYGQLGTNQTGNYFNFTPAPLDAKTYLDLDTYLQNSSGGSYSYACAIDSSEDLYCWGRTLPILGSNVSVPTQIMAGTKFKKVKLYKNTNPSGCALTTGNDLYCWGPGSSGQRGDGSTTNATGLFLVNGGHDFMDFNGSNYASCGVRTDGKLYCWGLASALGTGSTASTPVSTPTFVHNGPFVSVQMSDAGSCALKSDQTLMCWGGYPGNGSSSATSLVQVGGKYTDYYVSGSYLKTKCALNTSQKIVCWGEAPFWSANDSLGDGSGLTDRKTPYPIASSSNFTKLKQLCGVTTTGDLECWGYNISANPLLKSTPSPIVMKSQTADVFPMNGGYCTFSTNNKNYCWGLKKFMPMDGGQPFYSPVPAPLIVDPLMIAGNSEQSCYIDTAKDAFCWGRVSVGLGTGSNHGGAAEIITPALVAGGHKFKSIAMGYATVCAIEDVTNALYCWGQNSMGQVGNGSQTDVSVPTLIMSGTSFAKVVMHVSTACALTTGGAAYCWGNMYPIGAGSTSPTLVPGGYTWTDLAVSDDTFCGIDSGQNARCWGSNKYGGFGDSRASASTNSPVLTPGGHAFVSIYGYSGNTHEKLCAIDTNNDLYCWGDTMARVNNTLKFKDVGRSNSVTCGITLDDKLYCKGGHGIGIVRPADASTTFYEVQVGFPVTDFFMSPAASFVW